MGSQEELSMWEGKAFSWKWSDSEEVDWEEVKARYNRHYASAFAARSELRKSMQAGANLVDLKEASHNDELWAWVLQDDRRERALWVNGEVKQKAGPIHRPVGSSGLQETMYAPFKTSFGITCKTFLFNTIVLFLMTSLMWVALLFSPKLNRFQSRWLSAQKKSPQA